MPSWRQRVVRFFDHDLWSAEVTPPRALAWGRRVLQLFVLIAQEVRRDQLLLRASALTYYTILALIPVLAIALSLVQALGVQENLAQIIVSRVAAGSPEAGRQILSLVERVDFAGLGTLGAAVLVITTILGISSIERSLNGIWGVKRARSWERRFPDYLAVLIVAPLLLGVALSLGATLQSQTLLVRLFEVPGFEALYRLGLRQASFMFLWFGFAFLFWFLPNTRVRVPSALLGGFVAAVFFTLAQRAYVGFNIGAARYNALFGGLAALPLLLVWVYVSWVVFLLGAEVSFAHQHLAFFQRVRRREEPGTAAQEAIGVALVTRIARAFRAGQGGLHPDELADLVDAPVRTVRVLLADLERAGIVSVRGSGERETFQLGRAAETIHVRDVLVALRGEREAGGPQGEDGSAATEVLVEADRRSGEVLGAVTVAELAGRGDTAS